MSFKINSAEFLSGATSAQGYPNDGLAEVAFAGRSNVGKSSLLNKLVNRKSLAKTSSTPGRTRQLNFFLINDSFVFVDLPGYGYAKVSKEERISWGKLISEYLTGREQLKAIVIILDIRRDPSPEDLNLFEMIYQIGIPPIVALTKADKIKRGQLAKRKAEIAKKLDLTVNDMALFSAISGMGKDVIWRSILDKVKGD